MMAPFKNHDAQPVARMQGVAKMMERYVVRPLRMFMSLPPWLARGASAIFKWSL
jgi:hypothetical protein